MRKTEHIKNCVKKAATAYRVYKGGSVETWQTPVYSSPPTQLLIGFLKGLANKEWYENGTQNLMQRHKKLPQWNGKNWNNGTGEITK